MKIWIATANDLQSVSPSLEQVAAQFSLNKTSNVLEADVCCIALWTQLGSLDSELATARQTPLLPILVYRSLQPISPDVDFNELGRVQRFLAELEHIPEIRLRSFAGESELAVALREDLASLFADGATPSLHIIQRAVLMSQVRHTLLQPRTEIVVLQGFTGIGKTVIARALCNDEAIRAKFGGNVLWAVGGEQSDLERVLLLWCIELGILVRARRPKLGDLKSRLQQSLRTTLLVLEDVRTLRTVDYTILPPGNQNRVLITTATPNVDPAGGVKVISVPPLTYPESEQLLSAYTDLSQISESGLADLIIWAQGVPLVLRLIAGGLRRANSAPWVMAPGIFKAKTADQLTLACCRVHLLTLPEADLVPLMGVLPANESIPQTVLARLWKNHLPDGDLHGLVNELGERGLIDVGPKDNFSLHPLVQQAAFNILDGAAVQAHHDLLATYQTTLNDAGWHTILDDGYIVDHLVYHLAATKSNPYLIDLFANHAWMHARTAFTTGYAGYFHDLTTALQEAFCPATLVQLEQGNAPTAFGDCFYLTLLCSAVNSLTENYRPAVLAQALAAGLLSVDEAFRRIEQLDSGETRCTCYTFLLERVLLHPADRILVEKRAIDTVLKLPFETENGQTPLSSYLKPLAAYLGAEHRDQVLYKLLETANVNYRIDALCSLMPYLSPEQHRLVIDSAFNIKNETYRARNLDKLVPLISAALIPDLLNTAMQFQAETNQVNLLLHLIPYLDTLQNQAIFDLALRLVDEWQRVKLLAAVVPALDETSCTSALMAIQAIQNREYRGYALAAISAHLPEPIENSILNLILSIRNTDYLVKAVEGIYNKLNPGQRAQVGDRMQAAASNLSERQLHQLKVFVPYVDKERIRGQYVQLDEDGEPDVTSERLYDLVAYLSTQEIDKIIETLRDDYYDDDDDDDDEFNGEIKALARVDAARIILEHVVGRKIKALAPHLRPAQIDRVIQVLGNDVDNGTLEPLLPYLGREQMGQVLNLMTLPLLAPYLDEELVNQAVDKMLGTEASQELSARKSARWLRCLSSLAHRLSGQQINRIYEWLAAAGETVQHYILPITAILVPRVANTEQYSPLLARMQHLTFHLTDIDNYPAIVPHLQPAQLTKLLNQMFAPEDQPAFLDLFVELANIQSYNELRDLASIYVQSQRPVPGKVLAALASLLTGTEQGTMWARAFIALVQTLDTNEKVTSFYYRWLVKQAASLKPEGIMVALTEAHKYITSGRDHREAFRRIIDTLTPYVQLEQLSQAVRNILVEDTRWEEDSNRGRLLAALIDRLHEPESLLDLTLDNDNSRCYLLEVLMPGLARTHPTRLIQIALSIQNTRLCLPWLIELLDLVVESDIGAVLAPFRATIGDKLHSWASLGFAVQIEPNWIKLLIDSLSIEQIQPLVQAAIESAAISGRYYSEEAEHVWLTLALRMNQQQIEGVVLAITDGRIVLKRSVDIIAAIAPQLNVGQVTRLFGLRPRTDKQGWLEIIQALVPALDAQQLSSAFDLTLDFEDDDYLREDMLETIAPRLQRSEFEYAVARILQNSSNDPIDDDDSDELLKALVNHLDESIVRSIVWHALTNALTDADAVALDYLTSDQIASSLLQILAAQKQANSHLNEALIKQMRRWWKEDKTGYRFNIWIGALVPHLNPEQIQMMLNMTLSTNILKQERLSSIVALRALVPYLQPSQLETVVINLLSVSHSHSNFSARLLAELAPTLNVVQIQRILIAILTGVRSQADDALFPYLTNAQLDEALPRVLASRSGANQKVSDLLDQKLRMWAHEGNEDGVLNQLLPNLVPHLNSEQISFAIAGFIKYLPRAVSSRAPVDKALLSLLSYFNREHLQQILAIIRDSARRNELFELLQAKILETGVPLDFAVEMIVRTNFAQLSYLKLLPQLTAEQHIQLLEATFKVNKPRERLTWLYGLIPHLQNPYRRRGLANIISTMIQQNWAIPIFIDGSWSNQSSTLQPILASDIRDDLLAVITDLLPQLTQNKLGEFIKVFTTFLPLSDLVLSLEILHEIAQRARNLELNWIWI